MATLNKLPRPTAWVLPTEVDLPAWCESENFPALRRRAGWVTEINSPVEYGEAVRKAFERGFDAVFFLLPDRSEVSRKQYFSAVVSTDLDIVDRAFYFDLETQVVEAIEAFRAPDGAVSEAFLAQEHDSTVVPVDPAFFNDEALETEYKTAFLQYWKERMHLLDEEIAEMEEIEGRLNSPAWSEAVQKFWDELTKSFPAMVRWAMPRPPVGGLLGASSDESWLSASSGKGGDHASVDIPGWGSLKADWNDANAEMDFVLESDAVQGQGEFRQIAGFTFWFDAKDVDASPQTFAVDFRIEAPVLTKDPVRFAGTFQTAPVGNLSDWLNQYRIVPVPPPTA